jgi:hypothetical protein
MDGWYKKGVLALAMGAALAVSGVAFAADLAPAKPVAVAADKGKGPEKAAAKGADNAAKGADNAADKGKADEKGKGDEKSDKDKDGGAAADAAPADEAEQKAQEAKRKEKKEARKAKAKDERAELKKKVTAALKGQPMAQAMKQELERHARRLARLERVKDLAEEAKDTDAGGRVQKLIDKENGRHGKWMANYDAKAADKAGGK